MIRPQEIILVILITGCFVTSVYKFISKDDKTEGIYYMLAAIFMLLALK